MCCCLHISRENLNEMLDDYDDDEKLNTVEGKKVSCFFCMYYNYTPKLMIAIMNGKKKICKTRCKLS